MSMSFHSKRRILFLNLFISFLQKICCRLVALLSSSQYQDAFTSLAPASCQQACCKLIVKTFYPQAWYKIASESANIDQVVPSLIFTDLIQLDEANRLDETWWQTGIKLVKSTTCFMSVMFLTVYKSINFRSLYKLAYSLFSLAFQPILDVIFLFPTFLLPVTSNETLSNWWTVSLVQIEI